MCHQLPERSFFYKDTQFPVCARCTGVFIGQVVAFIMLFFTQSKVEFYYAFVLVIPAIIDWCFQQYLGISSNNQRRIITGSMLGYGYIFILSNIFILVWNLLKIGEY
ncbi:DUF2085 domain-containing protein [Leptospira sp. GIMC2001]|uniref:DUF2085 domain-containing protein n=1 Tax=Leptospira sp. GIMC2001 TaxID=1513297 RepID=UPI003FA5C37B